MPKTFILPVLRVEPHLGERIKADQVQAGDRSMAETIRRLLERGLGNPYLSEREADRLDQLLWETRQIGNNLNQLAKRMNTHGSLKDFQYEDLTAVTAKLGDASQKIRDLLGKAR